MRAWSKCTAQHRMTASKSALQLLCFFGKGLSQLLEICWCYFFSIIRSRALEQFLLLFALAFPAHLSETLLKRFPLHFKAWQWSEPGHCLQAVKTWHGLEKELYQIRTLVFRGVWTYFDQQLAKQRKRSKTYMKSRSVKAVCRAVLQTLWPQKANGEYKEGIVDVVQSAKSSDTAIYAVFLIESCFLEVGLFSPRWAQWTNSLKLCDYGCKEKQWQLMPGYVEWDSSLSVPQDHSEMGEMFSFIFKDYVWVIIWTSAGHISPKTRTWDSSVMAGRGLCFL